MKAKRILLIGVLAMVVMAIFFATSAAANNLNPDHKVYLTFTKPVEIPGQVLPPGTYVFKMVSPNTPHIAQILSADESKIYGTFFTMTIDRRDVSRLNTAVVFRYRKGGMRAVRGWFSPDETVGDELIYYKFPRVEDIN